MRSEGFLIAGVAVQYVATRLVIAGASGAEGPTSSRLALTQWLPIAFTTLAAVALRQPGVATALIFGSSVASLSLVLGMTTYVNPPTQLSAERRLWPLVLPAAIFVLLAGFRGHLAVYHAIMLLLMGLFFLTVWLERPAPTTGVPPSPTPPLSPERLITGLCLAAPAAIATVYGVVTTGEHARRLTPELLSATALSPLLLLPAVGVGTMLAHKGRADRVVSAQCGTVLLNLCLLLPVLVLVQFARAGHMPTPFPLITWRVDSVVLLVLAFALLPVSLGRWLPDRSEFVTLILVYAAYLVAETVLSVQLFN